MPIGAECPGSYSGKAVCREIGLSDRILSDGDMAISWNLLKRGVGHSCPGVSLSFQTMVDIPSTLGALFIGGFVAALYVFQRIHF